MIERVEALRTAVRERLHRLSSDAIATGKRADVDEVANVTARAICEHLGLTHEVKRAMAAAVMRLDDPDQEVQQRASTGVAAIATLLEAAGVER